jgi:hypothetical protein
MSRRPLAALALGAFLASLVACLSPVHDPADYPQLSAVKEGDKAADVRKAMGAPDAVASGWWSGANRFDMDYQVWYYAKKGRVVFDQGHSKELVVHTSEADETEDGRP